MSEQDPLKQQSPSERRRFQRIAFTATADIRQGTLWWPVNLLDISFKGALTSKPTGWKSAVSDAMFNLDIVIDRDQHIEFTAMLKHQQSDKLGFHCEHMTLDSMTILRRLVELNLGDPALLERELTMLVCSD